MAEQPGKNYIERSRRDRRAELAKLARDRHADMSVIIGLSWRIESHQAHIDYTGALDMDKIRRNITSLAQVTWRVVLRHLSPIPTHQVVAEGPETNGRTGVNAKLHLDPRELPPWSDALATAAPGDFQRRLTWGPADKTAEVQHARLLAASQHKACGYDSVLERINTRAMASLARDLLEERLYQQSPATPQEPHPLPQISHPFFGSGHVFYVIQFWSCGRQGPVKWIMKIPSPGEGGCWDEPSREGLRTEAFLLHKLRTETTMPVPEVIDADCGGDNEIGAPWLLMEFVQGRRLEDVWFGLDNEGGADIHANTEALKKKRKTILRDVAEAMLQLGRYKFDRGGAVSFDAKHGHLFGVQALQELNVQRMVNRWLLNEECRNLPLYRPVGPWGTTMATYTAMLDAYPPNTVAGRGVDELLRLLVGYVREPVPFHGAKERFVLTHPDLSLRNVILADDGTTIKAFLGWNGARAVPCSLGNEAFPRWLVRDFNPFIWHWWPATELWWRVHVPPEVNWSEDSPWVLRELREYYVHTITELKATGSSREGVRRGGEKNKKSYSREDVLNNIDVTRQSLLTLTLDAAIRDPRCRSSVLRRILEKCSRRFEELDFEQFVDELGKGHKIETVRLKCLADNIRELVDKGFVKGTAVW
jgi:hypothetical protein